MMVKSATTNAPVFSSAPVLAQGGFYVHPLEYHGKKPISLRGCKDATSDVRKVSAWARQFPAANIGIATGYFSDRYNIGVLDIDGDDGRDSLLDLERSYGALPG